MVGKGEVLNVECVNIKYEKLVSGKEKKVVQA